MTRCRPVLASQRCITRFAIRVPTSWRWAGCLLSWFLATAVSAEDWPQFRGPNRDGFWHETGILKTFPPDGLKIAWRARVGRGLSSPVVAQGRVFLTDVQLQQPAAKERVLCFDEASGQQLWSYEYAVAYPDWAFDPQHGGGPRATPVIRDGRLYTLGALGNLLCFDAAKGTVVWEKNLAQEYGVKEFTGITASPLIDDRLLVLCICAKPDAGVVAFDRNTGLEVWKALDDSFTFSSPIILQAGGKKQLITWTQEAVTSLDPASGQIWWREELRTPGDHAVATPVCSDHRLLIGGLMLKLDADKPAASVLWPETKAVARRILSNTSTALLQGEHVFSAKTSGELVCLEAGTGKQVWQADHVTDLIGGSSIHMTPCGDSVFLFTDKGDLILAQLTPQSYREISRTHLLAPTSPYGGRLCAWTPPAFANRHVFARNDGDLICVSLAAEP